MVQAILVWVGGVLAVSLLLLMAIGPAIVELDSWWYERKHNRKRVVARTERTREQVGHQIVVLH